MKCSSRISLGIISLSTVILLIISGSLTQATAQQTEGHGGRDSEGDRANSIPQVPWINISESLCPVVDTITVAADGVEMPMSYRKPPGEGPFPAIVFFHGGALQAPKEILTRSVKSHNHATRFLEKGFVIAVTTRRPGASHKNAQVLEGGLQLDCLASVEFVKQLPFIDSGSVVVFGGSMGGALGLLVAGKTQLATLVSGEPASHVLTGILLKTESNNNIDILQSTDENSDTSELQQSRNLLGKHVIEKIRCPVLIFMGDFPTDLNIHNKTVTIPEFKSLGKEVTVIEYPGLEHNFSKTSEEELDRIVNDAALFIIEHIRTQPSPRALPGKY
jgi:dipeptidyl aminopeptidase/acylaminoacyl peptidase